MFRNTRYFDYVHEIVIQYFLCVIFNHLNLLQLKATLIKVIDH